MINYSTLKIGNSIFIIVLLNLLFIFPKISYSQKDLVFINNYTNEGVFYENKLLINDEFVEFKNDKLNIRLSKNYELIDIQYSPLGIKWSGNIALFEKEYNEGIKILSEDKYNKLDQEHKRLIDLLFKNNDAVLKYDSIVSFKENFVHYNLVKSGSSNKILGNKAVKYYSADSSDMNLEVFFGYKLSTKNINALATLNTIIQKVSSTINKTYSINLNFINSQETNYFPLRVTEFDSKLEIVRKEEVIVVQKVDLAKNKCKPNNNYQSLSLFDFLIAAKNEISK